MSRNITSRDILNAHKYSIDNKENITKSYKCGCFSCLNIFTSNKPMEWINKRGNGDDTALCPYCSVDAVLPDISDYPITTEFLTHMKKYWFETFDRKI